MKKNRKNTATLLFIGIVIVLYIISIQQRNLSSKKPQNYNQIWKEIEQIAGKRNITQEDASRIQTLTNLLTQVEHHSPPSVIIEPGSGVETASYVIFKGDEGKIYAKNGLTGAIEFSGTDASAVIQSAIDALTNGGKIFIKAGTYTITSPVNITNGGITIEGEINSGDPLTYGVKLNLESSGQINITAEYTTLRYLWIRGDNLGQSFITTEDVPGRCGRVLLDHLTISGSAQENVYMVNLRNGERTYIDHCNIGHIGSITPWTNCALVHLYGDGYHSSFIVKDSEIGSKWYGNSTVSSQILIEANTSDVGAVIRDSHIYSAGGSTDYYYCYGVHVKSDSRYPKVTIKDNEFENCRGVYTSGSTDITLAIRGNTFSSRSDTNFPTIVLTAHTKNPIIQNNKFDGTYAITDYVTYPPNAGIISGNYFVDGVVLTDIYPHKVFGNVGYVTENRGTATVANNEWIAHGLAGTPELVTLTSRNATAGTPAEPIIVSCINRNSTMFQVGVYWANGTAYTTDNIVVDWYAEYKP